MKPDELWLTMDSVDGKPTVSLWRCEKPKKAICREARYRGSRWLCDLRTDLPIKLGECRRVGLVLLEGTK